jgi:putative aldouronate transport system substrate-binding protein
MGEKEPTTMDEWYQLFKKVKARYPDMVVLCERSRGVDVFTHLAFDMGKIEGYYGIIGSDFDKHQITYLPITTEWRDMLMYYNKLYTEGLLDPEYLTIQYNDWWEGKLGGGRAFACWTQNFNRADEASMLAHDAGLANVQWTVAETVKNFKTGERVQYKTGNPWQDSGWALNAKSKVKEAAIRFADYFFSDEYVIAHTYGDQEGVTYRMRDGKYSNLLPELEINKIMGGDGFFDFPAKFEIQYPYDTNPPMPATITHFEKNFKYVKIIPTVVPAGNIDRLTSISTDLETFADTAMDEFITGRRSFSTWDRYVQEVKALGSDEGVGIVQSWYDSYWKSAGK